MAHLDIEKIRKDFPILHQEVYGKPLIYLDNAATSQKPLCVINAIKDYYEKDNANVHRGIHALSQRATDAYEACRVKVQEFIHAPSLQEIIFTRGTTESINLIAQSYGRHFLKPDDEIIISEMEHHSNIVPWQLLCEEKGCLLKVVPMNDAGEFLFEDYEKLLSPRTKIVAVTHISNALGTINPIKAIIEKAHEVGAITVIDGAQAAPHTPINVHELDCDFYCFSAHKVYGPTGIGILYGKRSLLEAMPPYQGGGEMIKMVTFKKTIYHDLPHKFEAGTPPIAGVIGLGAALSYVNEIGLQSIANYEHELLEYGTAALLEIPAVKLIGTAKQKASILGFILNDFHPHDIGTILDHEGIAVRSGHHCAMPVMEHFHVPATVRASFAFYNTKEEIDGFIAALHKVTEVLA